MRTRHVVLSHPVRTAIGAYNGTLKGVPATELGAIVVRETLRCAGLGGDEIGTVVMGNVIQAGNRMNPARQASIGGGGIGRGTGRCSCSGFACPGPQ
jgi:acetyl-CoA C-acetyltransferase